MQSKVVPRALVLMTMLFYLLKNGSKKINKKQLEPNIDHHKVEEGKYGK